MSFHVLLECPIAVSYWRWVSPILDRRTKRLRSEVQYGMIGRSRGDYVIHLERGHLRALLPYCRSKARRQGRDAINSL